MSGIQLLFIGGGGGRKVINLSIASPAYNYDVYTNRGPTYVAGNSDITVTVSPGVTVGSTSTSTFAFLVPSAFSPTDTVTVVNNGVIQGRGGNGGNGNAVPPAVVPMPSGGTGLVGGAALSIARPTTITNNGTLAGGGGGGGGGGGAWGVDYANAAGGGGGGGAGFDGGTAGGGGPAGNNGIPRSGSPGSVGTSPAGGAGGNGGFFSPDGAPYPASTKAVLGGTGGTGGGRGASGSSGGGGAAKGSYDEPTVTSGGGGGGSPGAYIVGNPFVTYPATGTRLGPSS